MNQFVFLKPEALFFLWVPMALLVLGIVTITHSRNILSTSFNYNRYSIISGKLKKSVHILFILGFVLITFALSRPSWGEKETTVLKKGRDVAFVIDVSRSMLAEDLYPNRLEHARISILDSLSVIEGDRVALVAFAGSSVIKCPLTLDYDFFRTAVYDLNSNSVNRGGSMIGDALRKTLTDVFKGSSEGYRDIILITDGEDQESYPVEAAETLAQSDIRLIAIGLGDENIGKRIPVTDSQGNTNFLTYNNQEIWSKLDADTLRKMTAKTAGGRYLNVSTGTFDLGNIYSTLIRTQEKKFIEEETTILKEERFQYFLFPGILIVIIALILERVHFRRRSN